MPPYVAVPYASSIGLRPGYFGANYVGIQHNPFETDGDPNSPAFQVQNIQLAQGLSLERLQDRQGLSQFFDKLRRGAPPPSPASRIALAPVVPRTRAPPRRNTLSVSAAAAAVPGSASSAVRMALIFVAFESLTQSTPLMVITYS